ncbi:ABC transporter ATP-binding protein [Magnetospirillum sp. SS-4]|uniref:ABC transporter ATP-binding protein n=1 Tax=Magnetospirillum sp. SS-4 TaxID=2681465 RepID=UPI001C2D4C57|nr:ABC transporter ATP-binding protein [Magnetospirillum sp. SS-4]
MPAPSADPGLTVRLRQTAPIPLDVALSCRPGEVLALVGPSGSGKSTVLRSVAGLYRPGDGLVVCDGAVWLDTGNGVRLSPQQRSVGLVFQSYALFPHMTALDNVMAAMGHVARADRRARAMDLLARLHLDGLESRSPAALSGGQQQRVAVARALARDPKVLLLDEPFSAVDRVTRQKLYVELAELRRDLSIPTLLVTHDLEEASTLADTLSILRHGRTLQTGTPTAVKARPDSVGVARLVDVRNIFDGVVLGHDQTKTYLGWQGRTFTTRLRPDFEPLAKVAWCIPASHVLLHRRDRPTRGDAENPVQGVVTDLLPLGETVRMTVAIGPSGACITVPVLVHVAQRNHLEPGTEVTLTLRAEGIHLMPSE